MKNQNIQNSLYKIYRKKGAMMGFSNFEDFELWTKSKREPENKPFSNLKTFLKK